MVDSIVLAKHGSASLKTESTHLLRSSSTPLATEPYSSTTSPDLRSSSPSPMAGEPGSSTTLLDPRSSSTQRPRLVLLPQIPQLLCAVAIRRALVPAIAATASSLAAAVSHGRRLK